ncbi:PadR family transcriptional regulator [Micromonospora sp. HM5-17]|jgi:DNA-binding PadR family transcriptional regulator|uniref:PadR family transcriptional regulator n=1 Tax=Micromonospora sp. HM5-17 TaxID=2487710 RepID=UPI000F489E02|nr:helix-turn-helix transcriptional regulator [Micromonospora sp. HM5-17]ROT32094.1 PadR family transcriptional regulator [Micromonospora sp. HM5-17]
MNAQALHGHLDALLLAVLEGGPLHGYAIIEALRTRSRGVLALPTGTIYPALRRLERAGYVSSVWSTVNGRARRTYELTDAGRRALAGERSNWRTFSSTVARFLGSAEPLLGSATPPAAPV